MNNKGFTLIELVATIALLAVISVISFVSINKFVNDSKIENCKTLVNNIEMAAKEYVTDHRYDPTLTVYNNRGQKETIITMYDLIPNYLSEEIVDPYTNESLDLDDYSVFIELNDDYTTKTLEFYYTPSGNEITCGKKSFEYR